MDNGKEETEEAPIVQAARAVDAAQIRVNAAQLAFAKAEEELKAAGIDLAAARNDLATCLEPPKPAQAQKIDGINPASDLFKVLTAIREPKAIAQIVKDTGVNAGSLSSYLSDLKRRGLARREAAGVWVRTG
jgi:hypothetical protein